MTRSADSPSKDIFGAIALLTGLGIGALGAGFFPAALGGAHAPMWVLLSAGGIFALAGISILTQGRMPREVQAFLGNCMLTLFALIPAWIAWGGGRRSFSGSAGFLGFAIGFDAADIGRSVFALSALIVGLIALVAWLSWLAKMAWAVRLGVLAAAAAMLYLLLEIVPAEPRWPDIADDHARLGRYALLAEDEGWLRHKGSEPAHWYYPPWRNFEQWTKATRSRLAAARSTPPEATVLTIPHITTTPTIDGAINGDEWRGALRLPLAPTALAPEALASSVLLASDGRFLYLAADAPADTTATGFDQFRIWYHIGLSPWLDNERAFVDRSGGVSVLRATRFPWGDYPPRSRTDWHIYENARGAASMNGHRRFELAIDLAEAGIAPGVAFPAWLEIEGDPLRDTAGKFKSRSDLGRAGSHTAPLWLRIAAP